MALHDAEPAPQRAAERQRPGERPERLLVVRRDDEQLLAPRAGGDRLEAQPADAAQAVEALWRDLLRDAVDPDRALRARRAVVQSVDGVGMVGSLAPGDWVSMHWEWICDRLTEGQVARLRRYTERHLAIVNDRSTRSSVPTLLG